MPDNEGTAVSRIKDGITNRVESFEAVNPNVLDDEGNFCGYYTLSLGNKEGTTAGKRFMDLRVTLTPFGSHQRKKPVLKPRFSTETDDPKEAEAIQSEVESWLEEQGFFKQKSPMTESSLRPEIDARLAELMEDRPKYAEEKEVRVAHGEWAIYSISLDLPKNQQGPNASILINARPQSDIERSRTHYIEADDALRIGLKTKDEDQARSLLEVAKVHLNSKGLREYHLLAGGDSSKLIPRDWVEPSNVRVGVDKRTGKYKIILVSSLQKEGDEVISVKDSDGNLQEIPVLSTAKFKNVIATSSLTSDYDQIVAMRNRLVVEFIRPRQEDFSIDDVQEWFREQGFEPDPPGKKRNQVAFDTRDIYTDDGRPIARTYTQNITGADELVARFRIAPAGATARSFSQIDFTLNTVDEEEARRLSNTIRDAIEASMVEYFSNHPDAILPTIEVEKIGGSVRMFRQQPNPDISIEMIARGLNAVLTDREAQERLHDRIRDPRVQEEMLETLLGYLDVLASQPLSGSPSFDECNTAIENALSRLEESRETEQLDDLITSGELSDRLLAGLIQFSRENPEYVLWQEGDEVIGQQVDRERFVDFDRMREIIRNDVDNYARKIAWQISIEPQDDGDRRGRQTITVQAVREISQELTEEELVGEAVNGEGLTLRRWNRPIVVEAESLESAQAFRGAITSALLGDQSDQYISRLRGVDHFGDPSAGLVLRESFMAGLALEGIEVSDGPDSTLLSFLQREARREYGRTHEGTDGHDATYVPGPC